MIPECPGGPGVLKRRQLGEGEQSGWTEDLRTSPEAAFAQQWIWSEPVSWFMAALGAAMAQVRSAASQEPSVLKLKQGHPGYFRD